MTLHAKADAQKVNCARQQYFSNGLGTADQPFGDSCIDHSRCENIGTFLFVSRSQTTPSPFPHPASPTTDWRKQTNYATDKPCEQQTVNAKSLAGEKTLLAG